MKKDIKINMSKLSIGGMEKALVNLLTMSDLRKNYNITLLVVYNDKNNYINELPNDINVDIVWKGRWNLFGKLMAGLGLLKRILFSKKYYASICYSHHHKILSDITRKESDNNIVFIHADIAGSRTAKKLNKLCKDLKFDQFKKVVCVSDRVMTCFDELYPNYKGTIEVINNYIDGNSIIEKSKDSVDDLKKEDVVTFINVTRHEEKTKKITRIIDATERLNKDKYDFRVVLVGEGKDTDNYKKMIEGKNISNIIMLGNKYNPYPYYVLSDAFVFSSTVEGYGIVLNESRVLNIPVITTDIADAKKIVNQGYGLLCENTSDGIYIGMKRFLDEGYVIKNAFNYNEFNEVITEKINRIVED